jgi:hypothetical protein
LRDCFWVVLALAGWPLHEGVGLAPGFAALQSNHPAVVDGAVEHGRGHVRVTEDIA